MSTWTPAAQRLGRWSALAVVTLAAVYIATGGIWLLSNLDQARVLDLAPSEPYLTILEILMLLLNPALVGLFAAVHAYAPADRKAHALAAFGFVLLLVAITSVVHFVQLTVVRRTTSAPVAEMLAFYSPPGGGPTAMFAAEMLGWDLFFGFAMLCAAPVFKGDRLRAAVRATLMTSGALCLVGFAGPASGDMRFQVLAILGYAFGFPLACLLLAMAWTDGGRHAYEPHDAQL